MKIYQKEPKAEFEPIIIELDTQEDVDVFYAILNHTQIINAFEPVIKVEYFRKIREYLALFRSGNSSDLWVKLCAALRDFYTGR